jgi:hypothetical protein
MIQGKSRKLAGMAWQKSSESHHNKVAELYLIPEHTMGYGGAPYHVSAVL